MLQQIKRNPLVRRVVLGGVIAAAYAVLCLLLQPISFEAVQFRLSEALCILPLFFPEAVAGLFVGCLLSNLLGGVGILDIVFGSLATLLAAWATRRLRRFPLLALLPPVLVNAVVIGLVLYYAAGTPLMAGMGSILVSQAAVCYLVGYPLYLLLRRYRFFQTGQTEQKN